MNQTDTIILELKAYLRFINKIDSDSDFTNRIGMFRATLTKIKNGTAHFTVEHIRMICKEFNVNANFILALSPVVFNTPDSIEIDKHLNITRRVKPAPKNKVETSIKK